MGVDSNVGTIVDIQHSNFPYYLQQVDLTSQLKCFSETFEISHFAPANLFMKDSVNITLSPNRFSPTLFVGRTGIRTSLHYDRGCEIEDDTSDNAADQYVDNGVWNLFFQLSG